MKKLIEVVQEYKLRSGRTNELNIRQLAISGYRNLNMIAFGNLTVKVAYLPISSLDTVEMPSDYVNYTKVGVVYGNTIWTLTTNNKLLGPKNIQECAVPIQQALTSQDVEVDGTWSFVPHINKNGEFVGRMYGLGGGWNSKGYFKEDRPNRQFILDGITASEIVLEYTSDMVGMDTYVPQEGFEALIAWLDWQHVLRDPTRGLGEKQMFGQIYANEKDLILKLRNPFRMGEFLDAFYDNVHMSVKR